MYGDLRMFYVELNVGHCTVPVLGMLQCDAGVSLWWRQENQWYGDITLWGGEWLVLFQEEMGGGHWTLHGASVGMFQCGTGVSLWR